MRVNINSNGLYSITSVDAKTLNTVMFLLGTIKERCFKEYDTEHDNYLSGEDFVAVLSSEELRKFYGFVDGFWMEYDNMKSRFNLKKQK
jgi:hypothetical protein